MKRYQIPLAPLSATKVLMFDASATECQEAGQYRVSFTVCVREYDPDGGYFTDKHELYQDYGFSTRLKFPRKGTKAANQVIAYLEGNLPRYVEEACTQYCISREMAPDDLKRERFTYQDYKEYLEAGKIGKDNPELRQITDGFVEALLFCRDFDGEEEFEGEFSILPLTMCKIEYLCQEACNQLQKSGVLLQLIDIGVPLSRIGQCLYYDIVGHGVGFRDEKGVTPYLVEQLEAVLSQYYLHLFHDHGFVGMDVSINKKPLQFGNVKMHEEYR